MRTARTMFAAIFAMAFMQNAFAEVPPAAGGTQQLAAAPDSGATATTPADCASKPTNEEKNACLKQAADAVKAAEAAKAAVKPADKAKQKPAAKKCPSAEEWQKLLAGKETEIGELKAKVAEVTKARNEFESKVKKTEAELAGANEETASATALADAKAKEAKDAENACAASFEARIRAAESNVRDAEARVQAAEAKAKAAAEQALAAAKQPTPPAPPAGGQPPAPAEPTNVPEDLRPCVVRLVASRFHKGGEEAAIKRCNERILAIRGGK